jgi:serine/threonine-protein kinase
VVAYELLAGAKPYKLKRGSAAEVEEAIATADAPLASATATDARTKELKGDLDAILNKALKKTTNERYATVDALARDFERYLTGQGVVARPDTVGYRLSRFVRRQKVPLLAAAVAISAFGLAIGAGATALVILALLVGLGAALWQAGLAREQARRARVEGRTAEAVKRFLLDIFETSNHNQADPQKAQQTTARELLDIGLSRIATSLRDEPEARISVLETLSEMYYQIGLRSDALRLQSEATDLARTTFGPHDLRFARIALICCITAPIVPSCRTLIEQRAALRWGRVTSSPQSSTIAARWSWQRETTAAPRGA